MSGKRSAELSKSGSVVRLGMPHLADIGLNENWVIRTAGDRHWRLIGRRLGTSPSRITDRRGRRLYASFVCLDLRGALDRFREDDRVRISTRLAALGPRRFYSCTRFAGSRGVVTVELVSIFIRRKEAGTNRVFTSETPHTETVRPGALEESDADRGRALLAEHRRTRAAVSAAWDTNRTCRFRVVPTVDFNGARFLYFANFQVIDDRAFHVLTGRDHLFTTRRKIHYYGNVDRGEDVIVSLGVVEEEEAGVRSVASLRRASDGGMMAVVTTERGLLRRVDDSSVVGGAG